MSDRFDPEHVKPGQVYEGSGVGVWVVEAVFKGPTVVYANDSSPPMTMRGVVHMRNQELGYRLVARLDDHRLKKMKKIHEPKDIQ